MVPAISVVGRIADLQPMALAENLLLTVMDMVKC